MKSWTVSELNNLTKALVPLVGLRLQEVRTSAEDVVLGFYSPEGMLWLWADLAAAAPSLLPWTVDLPIKAAWTKTPLHLFIRAHFIGLTLSEIKNPNDRVVQLNFDDEASLELRILPHVRNILAFKGKKKIAWQKPRELPPSEDVVARPTSRDLETLRDEWLAKRGALTTKAKFGGKAKGTPVNPAAKIENEIRKKEKALGKVREELVRKRDLPWKEIGQWLKTNQNVNVPKEWEPFVDKKRKLSWNIEQCFQKARESDNKILGTKTRENILLEGLEELRLRLKEGRFDTPSSKPVVKRPSLGDMSAQGRTLKIDEGLSAVAGKSAVDNMKILRKARSWDLWFHLRDYPSSHAVLFRNKNATVSDSVLREVAIWFTRTTFGAKAAAHSGEKFDVVIAECRHVKPIRGDKIGRVTYQNERLLIIQLP